MQKVYSPACNNLMAVIAAVVPSPTAVATCPGEVSRMSPAARMAGYTGFQFGIDLDHAPAVQFNDVFEIVGGGIQTDLHQQPIYR